MNLDYYFGVVKHLLVLNNCWNQWVWETICEWDCFSEDAFDFMYEMCYCFHLL